MYNKLNKTIIKNGVGSYNIDDFNECFEEFKFQIQSFLEDQYEDALKNDIQNVTFRTGINAYNACVHSGDYKIQPITLNLNLNDYSDFEELWNTHEAKISQELEKEILYQLLGKTYKQSLVDDYSCVNIVISDESNGMTAVHPINVKL